MVSAAKVSQHEKVLSDLWRNWAVGNAALLVTMLSTRWLGSVWSAFLACSLALGLYVLTRSENFRMGKAGALDVMTIAIRALFVSAITIYFLPDTEPTVIISLIVMQSTAFFCIVRLCREIPIFGSRRHGISVAGSLSATLSYREARYQALIMLFIGLFVYAVDLWYYCTRYVDTHVSAGDRFFFYYMPAIAYVVSLLFLYGRYARIGMLCKSLDCANSKYANRTVVRILIFSGDELLLKKNSDGLFDTPVLAVVEKTSTVGERQVELIIEEKTALKGCGLRYCYTDEGDACGSNVVHYAAFLPAGLDVTAAGGDLMADMSMMDYALEQDAISPVLEAEIFRLHTVTMAWKTYDALGKRRYPVPDYTPTFRFSDMPNWDVDYDDSSWLYVAKNNEDTPFFRLRSAWKKLLHAKR